MSDVNHPPGLWPVPGDGVLARRGSLILLSSLGSNHLVDTLLDLLERIEDSGGDGRRFADAVAEELEVIVLSSDPASGEAGQAEPSALALGSAGSGLAITVSGGAWADVVTAHGVQRIAAGQPGTLLRCLLAAPFSVVRGGLDSAGIDGEVRTDRFSRLDGGTVRASGFCYYAHPMAQPGSTAGPQEPAVVRAMPVVPARPAEPAVPAEAAVPAEPAVPADAAVPAEHAATLQPAAAVPFDPVPFDPEPFDLEPFDAVLLVDVEFGAGGIDLAPRQPLSSGHELLQGNSYAEGPIIQGVYCKNGHFDDPEASFCAICGISMNQQTLVPRPGPRPPLGVLLVDDGAVFQLDKDYIVGREPSLDSSVAAGLARPLRVADDAGIVSRVHARVQLDGWRVLVTDLGSANGTRVRLPRQSADQVLAPQVPVVLAPGSQIDLGGRGLRYESHRGR